MKKIVSFLARISEYVLVGIAAVALGIALCLGTVLVILFDVFSFFLYCFLSFMLLLKRGPKFRGKSRCCSN